jgi:hypothetical protein
MPSFKFTDDDLRGRRQLAGWKQAIVVDVIEEMGKKDPTSTNYVVTVKTQGNQDPGEDGITMKSWFSSTQELGRQLFANFLKCFIVGKPDKTKSYDLDAVKDRQVEAFCVFDVDTGYNKVKDWRPARSASPREQMK